jgi:hypothetical protein
MAGSAHQIDPMEMPVWTLGQAVAWITWRTAEKVQEYGDDSVVGMMLDAAVQEPEVFLTTARMELFMRLAEGALTAMAINEETGRPEAIPAEVWPFVEYTADRDRTDRLWFNKKLGYRDIKLKRGDVCRLWEDAKLANKGGRPPVADWEAYYVKFLEKVKADGFPNKLNIDGWRTQADVANWLADLAEKEGFSPGTSTTRGKAREFLAKAKLETGF